MVSSYTCSIFHFEIDCVTHTKDTFIITGVLEYIQDTGLDYRQVNFHDTNNSIITNPSRGSKESNGELTYLPYFHLKLIAMPILMTLLLLQGPKIKVVLTSVLR